MKIKLTDRQVAWFVDAICNMHAADIEYPKEGDSVARVIVDELERIIMEADCAKQKRRD